MGLQLSLQPSFFWCTILVRTRFWLGRGKRQLPASRRREPNSTLRSRRAQFPRRSASPSIGSMLR
jgi:hypothetical protein